MMRRHYDRISVVRYLDKLIKIEDCILLDSNLEICRNYMAEDFKGDVLVCFKVYTRHFWFRYSFDNNLCTEEKYNLSDRMTKLQVEILNNWDEIVDGTYISSVLLDKK